MRFVKHKLNAVREYSRCQLIDLHLWGLRRLYDQRPVPLSYWLSYRSALQRIYRLPDSVFPKNKISHTGASLPVAELTELLRDDLLGQWALDCDTISFLWKQSQLDRPRVIIECGAGVSTLVLAKIVAHYGFRSTNSASVFSLEQDVRVKETIESRLKASHLKEHVEILHTPISDKGHYEFDGNKLAKHLGSKKADWLIIDGPSGPEGCRLSTLLSLARFCHPGARWFLDDAFRDGELGILNQWTGLRGNVVEGIYPFGKGLASGIIVEPNAIGG